MHRINKHVVVRSRPPQNKLLCWRRVWARWNHTVWVTNDQTLVTSFSCIFLGCFFFFSKSGNWLLILCRIVFLLVLLHQSQSLLSKYYMCYWSLCLIKMFWCECFYPNPTSLGLASLPWLAWRWEDLKGHLSFVYLIGDHGSHWEHTERGIWLKLFLSWYLALAWKPMISYLGPWCLEVLNFESRWRDFHMRSSNEILKPCCERDVRDVRFF